MGCIEVVSLIVSLMISLSALVISAYTLRVHLDNQRREWRPYMSFDHVGLEYNGGGDGTGSVFTVRIILKNTGRTIVRCRMESIGVLIGDHDLEMVPGERNDEILVPVDVNLSFDHCFAYDFSTGGRMHLGVVAIPSSEAPATITLEGVQHHHDTRFGNPSGQMVASTDIQSEIVVSFRIEYRNVDDPKGESRFMEYDVAMGMHGYNFYKRCDGN